MRTVWLLRGDAPPAPTLDQLVEPDAVIISLVGLPMALARLTGDTELVSSSATSLVKNLPEARLAHIKALESS